MQSATATVPAEVCTLTTFFTSLNRGAVVEVSIQFGGDVKTFRIVIDDILRDHTNRHEASCVFFNTPGGRLCLYRNQDRVWKLCFNTVVGAALITDANEPTEESSTDSDDCCPIISIQPGAPVTV